MMCGNFRTQKYRYDAPVRAPFAAVIAGESNSAKFLPNGGRN